MLAAPEDVLTSLFCTPRSLVSVRARITPHFFFECHYATLQMFEGTCVDSFVQIAQYLPDASYPGVPFRKSHILVHRNLHVCSCLLSSGHPTDRNRAAETSSNSFRDAVASAPSAVSTCACAPRQSGTALSKARRPLSVIRTIRTRPSAGSIAFLTSPFAASGLRLRLSVVGSIPNHSAIVLIDKSFER